MSNRTKIIIAVVVVVVVAAIIIVNLKSSSGKTISVQTEQVKRGKLVHKVSGTGKIQPKVAVKISANVAARIIKIHVNEGDRVKKDQILVELDRTRYEAAVVQAKASLSSALAAARQQKASMEQSMSEYNRQQKLFEQGLTSQEVMESSKTTYEVAKARYEASLDQSTQAKAYLDQANDDLAKTTIRSPIDGVVTQLNKEEGEIALGSQFQEDVIMVVSALANIEAVVEVDENDVVNVSIGDSSRIRVDAFPDTVFVGKVSEIAHTATTKGQGTQEEVTNFEVKVTVTDSIKNVRPGMSANVDLVTDTRDQSLKIPIQAVTVRPKSEVMRAITPPKRNEKKGTKEEKNKEMKSQDSSKVDSTVVAKKFGEDELQEVVFVVENKMAKIRKVKTGITGDTEIEILDGLKEGETVVTGSYRALSRDLKDGTNVKVEKARQFQPSTKEGGR